MRKYSEVVKNAVEANKKNLRTHSRTHSSIHSTHAYLEKKIEKRRVQKIEERERMEKIVQFISSTSTSRRKNQGRSEAEVYV